MTYYFPCMYIGFFVSLEIIFSLHSSVSFSKYRIHTYSSRDDNINPPHPDPLWSALFGLPCLVLCSWWSGFRYHYGPMFFRIYYIQYIIKNNSTLYTFLCQYILIRHNMKYNMISRLKFYVDINILNCEINSYVSNIIYLFFQLRSYFYII